MLSTWPVALEVVQTLTALSIPVIVAVVAHQLNRRVKTWEASQWRNQELIKARLGFYADIAAGLNDLMCYFTFIGSWKELTPPEIIGLKRKLDRDVHVALPLFSDDVERAYREFMDACFETFGTWGEDARLKTGFMRRRDAAKEWKSEWEAMFTTQPNDYVNAQDLGDFRMLYNQVLGALAKDIQLLEPRDRYATADVSLNAH